MFLHEVDEHIPLTAVIERVVEQESDRAVVDRPL